MGGLAVSLEHRFFGDSLVNNDGNLTRRYETMTLDNAILDSVVFIKYVKETVNGAANSEVIVTGGTSCPEHNEYEMQFGLIFVLQLPTQDF